MEDRRKMRGVKHFFFEISTPPVLLANVELINNNTHSRPQFKMFNPTALFACPKIGTSVLCYSFVYLFTFGPFTWLGIWCDVNFRCAQFCLRASLSPHLGAGFARCVEGPLAPPGLGLLFVVVVPLRHSPFPFTILFCMIT